jgi:hypothetical protein
MSIGVLGGIVGSAAGAPLSQTAGSETERVQKEGLAQQRQVDTDQQAELAAGIGQTQEDQESSERDADGRRLWEGPANGTKEDKSAAAAETPPRQSRDTTGQCGSQLDLTG